MDELKPCPCCGGESEIQDDSCRTPKHPNGAYSGWCTDCGLMTDWYDTPELAAEAWNRRDGEEKYKEFLNQIINSN